MSTKALGLIGCGNLGSQFGLRALKAGLRLVAFDVDASRIPTGAEPATSIADLVARVGTVLSIVPDDAALRTVAAELNDAAAKHGEKVLHVSCSTVSPAASRAAAACDEVAFAAAPVFGRPENVRDDQATFMVSGPGRGAAASALASFAAPAERIIDFGDDAGAANVAKLCGNFMIGASIQTMAEALAIAEANDVDREQVMDLLSSTIFDCPIFRGYGYRVSRRDHRPGGFALDHGLKDVNLVRDTAQGLALPFATALQNQFRQAKAAGLADADWSAVALLLQKDRTTRASSSPADEN
eukprot:CAMPEP_0198662978 /NCGR_PEP_ID=MMETSP1467-20131203/49972_1 /TAXON_ID=1462469 /ORGANISM="unid. sp., Strain CCMP2135" /LENGTH=297 /DNA_ID=CAMNT_0044399483 /DNA_START=1 /DNA_END=894 /DNA_ORIENTATION=+